MGLTRVLRSKHQSWHENSKTAATHDLYILQVATYVNIHYKTLSRCQPLMPKNNRKGISYPRRFPFQDPPHPPHHRLISMTFYQHPQTNEHSHRINIRTDAVSNVNKLHVRLQLQNFGNRDELNEECSITYIRISRRFFRRRCSLVEINCAGFSRKKA